MAMSRDPADRFKSCDEFRSFLLPFAPGSSGMTGINLSTASKTAIRRALYEPKTPYELSQSSIKTKPRKPAITIGIIAALVVAAVVGVVVAFGRNEKNETNVKSEVEKVQKNSTQKDGAKAATSAKPAPLVNNDIVLKISAVPKEAVITIDGAKVSNPYTGKFIKNQANRAIVVSAAGYMSKSEMVVFDKDLTLKYELEKLPEPAPAKSSSKTKKYRKKSSSAKKPVKKEIIKVKKPGKKPRRKIDYDDPWG
jgi:hypothetical protein